MGHDKFTTTLLISPKKSQEKLEIIGNNLFKKTQTLEDFQPLSKPANDAKRQFCKECKESNLRYDAKLLGYSVSFIQGDINYTSELKCIGCFWYDPIAFRQALELKK